MVSSIGGVSGSDPFLLKFKTTKIDLKKEMITDAPVEQQNLLKYVSDTELEQIYSCYNHAIQDHLVYLVKAGSWKELMNETDRTLSILKAAYCQRKLEIDELATAFIFLSPKQRTAEQGIIHTVDEMKGLDFEGFHPNRQSDVPEQLRDRWQEIDAIPKHLRYFVSVDADAFRGVSDDDMETIARGSAGFIKYKVKGKTYYALGSAAMIRADRFAKGHPPVFVRGLTPRRADMFENLVNDLSDYALIDPEFDRQIPVHTGSNRGIFSYMHDSFHLAQRVRSGLLKNKDLLKKAKGLELQLEGTALLPRYINTIGSTGNKYIPDNLDDCVRYILSTALGIIADGQAAVCDSLETTMANAATDALLTNEILKNYLSKDELMRKLFNQHLRSTLNKSGFFFK